MRLVWSVALLFALAGCPPFLEMETRTLEHDGLERVYHVYVPDSYDGDQALPVVVFIHGTLVNWWQMSLLSGFNRVAEREGFIVVYPEGVNMEWNDGRGVPYLPWNETGIDDVGFVDAMLDALAAEYSIDEKRVYATGISNGAMMAHRLACELTERFAAIAPVSGTMPELLHETCAPSRPIPVLMFHGTLDPLVPWEGGGVFGLPVWGLQLSVEDTVAFWVEHNGCGATPEVTWEPNRELLDLTQVWREHYSGGLEGSEVVLYGIENGGHTWPGGFAYERQWIMGRVSVDVDATEIVWDFFAEHPKP
ncbi:MAG: polyhydroxybutyrate depolymerase [Candidatus Hydrogenedentes bacterium]|nr:polyhydroxybutyrate depolymerase [Candidatus Hydrogenedentota bacterium]